MALCGNGMDVARQTGIDWTNGANIDDLCNKMVAGKMNLMMMNMGSWSGNNLNNNLSIAQIISIVNRVHTYNANHPGANIKILNMPWILGPQDLSNPTARITSMVNFCNATGCDGISDDVEQLIGSTTAQQQIAYYNGATTALNAMNPPRIYACARGVGNNGAPYFDSVVVPQLRVNYFKPMFFNGQSTPTYINQYWDMYSAPGFVNCPLSIGCRSSSGVPAIISALTAKMAVKKPATLVGFWFWALDAGNATFSNSDWAAWNNWTGKNSYPNCGGTVQPVLTSITIPTSTSVGIGTAQQLTANCRDQNGSTMTCPILTWLSSNTAVATVNSAGLVTGIAVGTANITAKSGTITSNASVTNVTPTPPLTGNLLLNPDFESGTTGNPSNWTAKVSSGALTAFSFTYPDVGRSGADKSVSIKRLTTNNAWAYWSQIVNLTTPISSYKLSGGIKTQNVVSNNWGAYIQIDWIGPQGYISSSFSQKLLGTNNWTTVEVISPPPSGAIKVEIGLLLQESAIGGKAWFDDIFFGSSQSVVTLTTIVVTPPTASVGIGATQQLTATCRDQNGVTMTCPILTWTSSNISIATVSSTGLVTGIATGAANITARSGTVTSNISVITVAPAKKFTVSNVISGNVVSNDGVLAILDSAGHLTKDQACTEVCNRLGQL